jgi:2-succinyl-6-hydroxy-2,4-cyclohexadiene-1-carboxylate synthase
MIIRGINYHIEIYGTGEPPSKRPPCLLLHGFTGSGANWSAQTEVLQEYFRVVTIDLPGHGQTNSPSDPERYHIEQTAEDLNTIFDALELETMNLLGYSMGGRLALYIALTYPKRVNRLILESASPGLKTAAEREARSTQDEALADRIECEGIAAFAGTWTNLPLFATQSPEAREKLRVQRLINNSLGLANSLRGMGTGVQPSLWDRLPELEMPTLLLCGALDTKFSAINTEMHNLMPTSTLVIIPDAGHTTHVEQPEHFRAEVLAFLGETTAGALE